MKSAKQSAEQEVLAIQENNMYRYFICILSIFFFLFSSAQVNDSDVLIFDDEINYSYNFFEADKCFLDENYDLSENYYQLCLSQKPDNPFILYRLASIYLKRNELDLSENYIDRCLAFSSDNEWYLFLAGHIYGYNKHFTKAGIVFNKLISLKPTEIDFYLALADVYINENNYKKAINVYDLIEQKFGIDESISVQKKNIYLQIGNKKKAAAELNKLISAYPSEIAYKRLLADFYMQNDDVKTSISILNQIINENHNDGFAHMGLALCYSYLKDKQRVYDELYIGFQSKEVNPQAKVNILVAQMQVSNSPDDLEKMFKLCEVLLKTHPDDPDVNSIYANFQMGLGNIDIARLALNKVIETRKDKYQVWEQLLLIDNQLLDWVSMFKHSSEAIQYFPNMPFLYLLNGISSLQLSKIDNAKKSLEFGYQLISKDDPLQADYLTFLGEVSYRLDNKQDAYFYYDKLLEIEPDNLMVLNNYSYYLSLDKENLSKAEQMSFKTIKVEPNNPTYLDTYAWILFKMQNYKSALDYIKRAVDLDVTRSAVIIEHYGDILYFNNEFESALEQWKRAQMIGQEENDKLNEKIATHKYVE